MVRKMENISELEIPVQIDKQTTVYVKPGQKLENVECINLGNIQRYVRVEQDLAEVQPIQEKLTKIYG